ncbi:hypothetical protein JCM17844_25730 [Iodidimonas gelatinilytica]|uniref:CHASE2 domain-containing protein n=1 Tax=Iodidimonas gelatinilytica TaxID=1236966 RepID=A0A5A7MUY4_9PROT|nr:CHASE2 domain-containing protein [Iodidimonas gelatinilytica]GEQ98936.1 hypothetical protein JCM17844_25730 [Iodidimonas gelatinilytica]GEQ99711.1 hypothetical protein JCM17845_03350 [Iodidimonas gelatinilytica]
MALDPLGLVSAADHFSQDAFSKLTGPFHSQDAVDRITVVLIDDADIPIWPGESPDNWPISHADHLCLLRLILSYEPQSVFADILLAGEREDEGTGPLISFLSAYAQGTSLPDDALCGTDVPAFEMRPPILFADIPPILDAMGNAETGRVHSRERGLRADIAKSGVERVMVKWAGYGNLYPFQVPDGTGGKIMTPAVRMWQASLEDERLAADLVQAIETGNDTSGLGQPLELMWNARPYPGAPVPQNMHRCPFGTPSVVGRFFEMLGLLAKGIFHSSAPGTKWDIPQICQTFDTVHASELVRQDLVAPEQLSQRLKGRHVLIGANVSSYPDLIESPVSGLVPGVYLHATALDNLLLYGADYMRKAPEKMANFIEVILAVILAILHAPMQGLWKSSKQSFLGQCGGILACLSAFVGVVFLIVWVEASLWDYMPANWALLVAAAMGGALPPLDWITKRLRGGLSR